MSEPNLKWTRGRTSTALLECLLYDVHLLREHPDDYGEAEFMAMEEALLALKERILDTTKEVVVDEEE